MKKQLKKLFRKQYGYSSKKKRPILLSSAEFNFEINSVIKKWVLNSILKTKKNEFVR